jgi:hypothetical protein
MPTPIAIVIASIGQLDGAGKALEELGGDRAVGAHRRAEVAGQQPLHELAVLHPQRLVKAHVVTDPGPQCRRATLTEDGRLRAAGEPVQPHEQQQRQPEKRRNELKQPPHDEAEHRTPLK